MQGLDGALATEATLGDEPLQHSETHTKHPTDYNLDAIVRWLECKDFNLSSEKC